MKVYRTDFQKQDESWFDGVRQTVYEAPWPAKVAGSVVAAPIALAAGAEVAVVLAVTAAIGGAACIGAALMGAPSEVIIRSPNDLSGYENPYGPFADRQYFITHPKRPGVLIPAQHYAEHIIREQASDLCSYVRSVSPVSYFHLAVRGATGSHANGAMANGQFEADRATSYSFEQELFFERPRRTPSEPRLLWLEDFPNIRNGIRGAIGNGSFRFMERKRFAIGINGSWCRRYGIDIRWAEEKIFELTVKTAGVPRS